MTESQNARKQNTTYIYDKAGRITSMTDELGVTKYTYDANGNVLTVTDAQGTITREYDALNRVAKYTYDAENRLITYNGAEIRYDADGNMTYGPVNGVMSEAGLRLQKPPDFRRRRDLHLRCGGRLKTCVPSFCQ